MAADVQTGTRPPTPIATPSSVARRRRHPIRARSRRPRLARAALVVRPWGKTDRRRPWPRSRRGAPLDEVFDLADRQPVVQPHRADEEAPATCSASGSAAPTRRRRGRRGNVAGAEAPTACRRVDARSDRAGWRSTTRRRGRGRRRRRAVTIDPSSVTMTAAPAAHRVRTPSVSPHPRAGAATNEQPGRRR